MLTRTHVDPALLSAMARHEREARSDDTSPFARVGGKLALYCAVDLASRSVSDAASLATVFRGSETLLLRRNLREAGLVCSSAAGICGGVHATASALCLEMALGIAPPPLSIVARNLLLSCQFLSDHPMHLFVLSGPDYSASTVRRTNPEIWARAESASARHAGIHGHRSIGTLMADLERPTGRAFVEAIQMVRLAREAYALLGGKYPHSESFVPGGVVLALDEEKLNAFVDKLAPFADYAKRCLAIWNDLLDFLYEEDPRYQQLGESPATMLDFGQWDNEEHYDARYATCDAWGEQRWSTPGVIVDGKLVTTRLTQLNCGLEDFVERSYYDSEQGSAIETDPLGNGVSSLHPWNRKLVPNPDKQSAEPAYSWAYATTWQRRQFEVGAYARVYLAALAGKLPASRHLASTGKSLILDLPAGQLPALRAEWHAPARWNAFERVRARAYAVAFSWLVLQENQQRARTLLRKGEVRLAAPFEIPAAGRLVGAGLGGAGRGFLGHWAVIDDGVLANYRITPPSRINAGPRTPWGEPGACEQALLNTPIVESNFSGAHDFEGIDLVRAVQSFDPCTQSSLHFVIDGSQRVGDRVVTTDGS